MHVSLIYGPMFSGKTKRLIRNVMVCKPKARLIFKHRVDSRTGDTLSSHDSSCNDTMEAMPIHSLFQVTEWLTPEITHVFIDEAQFFEPGDLEDAVNRISKAWPKVKLVFAGLNLTWQGKSFPAIRVLRRMAAQKDQHFCQGDCSECGAPSTHSYLIDHERVTKLEIVGGEGAYESRCSP